MKEAIKLSAFVLLSIGTLGLITNEFIFDLGRPATLTFASINFWGLLLWLMYIGACKKTAKEITDRSLAKSSF